MSSFNCCNLQGRMHLQAPQFITAGRYLRQYESSPSGSNYKSCARQPAQSSTASKSLWLQVSGLKHVQQLFQSYLLPQGYPDSVAPEYARYMAWRGCQYFFGGAMSVFTTRSLLGALGVAGRNSGETAAAINWVVKDGAGRLGRFLFARW